MIVSASYRTDIPAFYTGWFLNRLRAGSCHVANPYGGGSYAVALTPEAVDGFVFWTRNLRPLLPHLDEVRRVAPFTVQFTVTGYPRALESSVIAVSEAAAQLQELRRRFGTRAAVWRYDPIVFTGDHLLAFAGHVLTIRLVLVQREMECVRSPLASIARSLTRPVSLPELNPD